ncbi:MAG: hypothetical protein HY774_25555 [Acidobacteria bacterium]|nr:hypothetical protein [Acidobacteriota bacterium]
MRTSLILLWLVILFGLNPGLVHSQKTKALVKADDILIIEAVINDFAGPQGIRLDPQVVSVLLYQQTRVGSGYVSRAQLQCDLQIGCQIPDEIVESLQDRNQKSIQLTDFRFSNPSLKVVQRATTKPDFPRHDWDFMQLKKMYPHAEVLIETYLPGYSKDRTQAAIRFMFEPTPHGASATFLLSNKHGKWEIQWRSIAYYT